MIGEKTGDQRVRRLLDELGLKYDIDGSGDFAVPFTVGEDRSQTIYIDSDTRYVDRLEVRHVWSIGLRSEAPLPADVANALLVYNANVNLGAWQLIREEDDEACIAIFLIPIAADTSAKALLSVMHAVGTAADVIEEKLTDEDKY